MTKQSKQWYVYILECNDHTLYTGITNDLEDRIHAHNHTPQGAKYTRGRRPVSLLYAEPHPSRASATAREYQIKQLSRKQKKQLIGKV